MASQEEDNGFTETMDNGGVMGYVFDKCKKALSRKKEESVDKPSGFKMDPTLQPDYNPAVNNDQ